MRIGPESRRVLNDASYRKLLYPERYTWPRTVDLLKQMEIEKALWFLINSYASAPQPQDGRSHSKLSPEQEKNRCGR